MATLLHTASVGRGEIRFYAPGDGLPGYPWVPLNMLVDLVEAYAGPCQPVARDPAVVEMWKAAGASVGMLDTGSGAAEWCVSAPVGAGAYVAYLEEYWAAGIYDQFTDAMLAALWRLGGIMKPEAPAVWCMEAVTRDFSAPQLVANVVAVCAGKSLRSAAH